jgi:hypothetical protein
MRSPFALLAAAALSLSAACSSEQPIAAESASGTKSDSAGGLVIAPSEPYKPTDTSSPSALVVTVTGDSAASAGEEIAARCNPEVTVKPAVETILWIDGIREGKTLPRERRYGLVSDGCGISPRMQGVVVGGAINVFNEDGAHSLLFVRAGTTDTLQAMPFPNAGALVATERLTRTPGIVEVSCTLHPNERAHIAVFDHPYFSVASSGARVTLDSLPAGDYRVLTWHAGMAAPAAFPTRVGPSGQTEVVVR